MSKYSTYQKDPGQLPRPAKGFIVKAEVRMTKYGLGTFAAEFIPANTKVQIMNESRYFSHKEALEYLESLPTIEEKKYWLTHVYEVKGKVAEDPYDQTIFNHSSTPNLQNVFRDCNDGYSYALRDIQPGEEFTKRYSIIPFLDELRKQHGVVWDFIYD